MDWSGFARQWCTDWNAHELDRVLDHFDDAVVFTSPFAARLFPDSGGRIAGKAALRAYWEEGLRRVPDLHFTVEHVFGGVDTLVIQYRNQTGARVSEVLQFRSGKVIAGHGTYEAGRDNPTGARA
jgi:ketosteroid isomerase-like protein